MKSRRERRAEARQNGTEFVPQYNSSSRVENGVTIPTGGTPKTHEEKFGVGYERFNNKFVTIKEVETVEESTEVTE